jgi:hypothetical protein
LPCDTVSEDRHLSEEVFRAEGCDLRPARADDRLALREHEEGVAGSALAGQLNSFAGHPGVEPGGELFEIAFTQRAEERNRAEIGGVDGHDGEPNQLKLRSGRGHKIVTGSVPHRLNAICGSFHTRAS